MIRLSYPDINENVLRDIREVLASGWLISGKHVKTFEEKASKYLGAESVAVSSGTAALHIALLAAGIGKGAEVIVADFSFPAPANMVEVVGARTVLADITLDTFNISVEDIERKITDKTRAIIAVDQFGHPAELNEIAKVARRKDIILIEDAACAFGAELNGKKCGTFGIGCFSFHPRKIITTGEGGLISASGKEFAEECRKLRNHGMVQREGKRMFDAAGFNYRMPEINAVLGLEQLEKINILINKRRELAMLMNENLKDADGIAIPTEKKGCKHIYQSYVVMLDKHINRDRVIEKLRKNDIESGPGTDAIHMQPYYMKKYGYHDMPNSANAASQAMALPIHSKITEEEVTQITRALKRAL